jgi:hypothetical protein
MPSHQADRTLFVGAYKVAYSWRRSLEKISDVTGPDLSDCLLVFVLSLIETGLWYLLSPTMQPTSHPPTKRTPLLATEPIWPHLPLPARQQIKALGDGLEIVRKESEALLLCAEALRNSAKAHTDAFQIAIAHLSWFAELHDNFLIAEADIDAFLAFRELHKPSTGGLGFHDKTLLTRLKRPKSGQKMS